MAVLERVAERLLRSSFVDLGTGTLGSSMYLLYFLMWYPSFINTRLKDDLQSHSKLRLARVISHICHEHNSSEFRVFVSSTTFGHKSCICNTIDSCRLFLHRVSSHLYLYHQGIHRLEAENRSEKSDLSYALLLTMQSASQRIHFASGRYVMYGRILCTKYILCPILYLQCPTHIQG